MLPLLLPQHLLLLPWILPHAQQLMQCVDAALTPVPVLRLLLLLLLKLVELLLLSLLLMLLW